MFEIDSEINSGAHVRFEHVHRATIRWDRKYCCTVGWSWCGPFCGLIGNKRNITPVLSFVVTEGREEAVGRADTSMQDVCSIGQSTGALID